MASYNHKKIEKKWREAWERTRVYELDLDKVTHPFYNLMMFPYPSAEGLHMGNVYHEAGVDIYGRLKRMQGKDVFEPIGLDGFGIHSENYALKIGEHPKKLAKKTEKRFYEQIKMLGNGLAWSNKLETYDPEYYRWTQWIFIQMFKHGLAYRKKAEVNWCPKCKTVLADEQVIQSKCERCDADVIKKDFEQWFFRITNYAERLLNDLENIDWSERIKIAQRNWIGRSEGAEIDFKIKETNLKIKVFTTRADTLFGATYVVLSPEHKLLAELKHRIQNWKEVEKYAEESKNRSEMERTAENKEKTGVELRGVKAINPANGEELPVFIADYVLAHYGTGAIMAVPAHDERDWAFAKKFKLPIRQVICQFYPEPKCPILNEAYIGDGKLVGSEKFNGMDSEKAKRAITELVGGKITAKYKLRDWLISRQRYWGPPIPMIYCEKCGWQSVPEEDLPVLLPDLKDFKPTGTTKGPLANYPEFYKVECPKCGEWATRETDVSDTFLDSSWYYYRYLSVENKKEIFDKNLVKKWLPVDMYMGGPEHAVMHLLYTRFITKVFYDRGLIGFDEPFKTFRVHGLVTKDGAKMSKSKGNIVNPDEYIKAFGADVIRTYLMFSGSFQEGGDFRDAGIAGITRFLAKIVAIKDKIVEVFQDSKESASLETLFHKTIKKVTEDIENLDYNTAISQLMILTNAFFDAENVSKRSYECLIKMLAPFAPFLAEELFQELNNVTIEKFNREDSVHLASWPEYDPQLIKEEVYELVIQINGKVRERAEVSVDLSEEDLREFVLKQPRVRELLAGRSPKKIIVVCGRLVNIVI